VNIYKESEPSSDEVIGFWIAKQLNRGSKWVRDDAPPLIASVFDLSPTGNLTIVFNKPIIQPPIRVFNETQIRERQ